MSETVTTPTGSMTRVQTGLVLDAFDPREYEATQPTDIPVLHRHNRAHRVGRVLHLEWGQGEPARILAVLEIDEEEAEHWRDRAAFISPGTRRNGHARLVLDHVGLVESTARIAASPVRWCGTTFEKRSRWTRQTVPGFDVLVRAHAALRGRAKGDGLPIVGHPGFDEQLDEQRSARTAVDPLMPEYMKRNGENGVFYHGGGYVLRVQ